MCNTELYYINKMTPLQKEVVVAMKEMGYKHDYFMKYDLYPNSGGKISINVNNIQSIKDIITTFYNEGSDQKRFELQRVLGI